MSFSSHGIVSSSWKDASKLDELARQVSSFVFPKRRLVTRLRSSLADLSVILWKEDNQYCLTYLTDQSIKAEHIGNVLDVFSALVDQMGFSLERVRASVFLSILAPAFESGFLSRLRFVSSKIEAHMWISSEVDQKEMVLLREVSLFPKPEENGKKLINNLESSDPLMAEQLTQEELSEFAQLGLDLRKIR